MFGKDPLTVRGRWLLITIATMVMQFSYWLILVAPAADEATGNEDTSTLGLLALGFALMPFIYMILAFGSRHLNAPLAVMKAMGLFIVLVPIGLLHPVAGLVAAYGAGGVAAIRREEELHSLKWRSLAVVFATVYVIVLLAVFPEFAAVSGAVLPFTVIGIADQVKEAQVSEGEPERLAG